MSKLFSISDPGRKAKKRKDLFSLKNKLEFAKQIVLEAGDYLRLHLHDDLMISKDWADRLVTQMDQQVQKGTMEKSQIAIQKIGFLREEDGLFVRRLISEGSVWVIDPH